MIKKIHSDRVGEASAAEQIKFMLLFGITSLLGMIVVILVNFRITVETDRRGGLVGLGKS